MTPSTPRRRGKRLALGCAVLLLVLLLGGLLTVRLLSRPLPRGVPGPEADALAHEMEAAVNLEAWSRVTAVAWDFDGRQKHLWDRARGLARVTWDDVEVLIDLHTRRGVVRRGGTRLEAGADAYLAKAWAHWANDGFWLNPVAKLFDAGTTRALVDVPDGRGLLVTYASGGVTPGDSYLWVVDDTGLPVRWEMWVSILPVGGLAATWEDWQTLPGGARVARRHHIGPLQLQLSDIRIDAEALGDGDPFAPLFHTSQE